tara:strand:+ start:2386 stop:3264 length:879 start_codon:yes stop_codon:yes gene_type:complete
MDECYSQRPFSRSFQAQGAIGGNGNATTNTRPITLSQTFENEFLESGFLVAKAHQPDQIEQIKGIVFDKAREILDVDSSNAESFFDNFHRNGLNDSDLNDFRVRLISEFNSAPNVCEIIFEAFKDTLFSLVGPDAVVQKSVNIVIQQPGDTSVSPAHRDAPPNSLYEVVVWLPLTKCYGTKGMSILDRSASSLANEMLEKEPPAYEDFKELAAAKGTPLEMDFGEALFFWTGLYHYIPVNAESETRWSLNLRFKNTFSPYGSKGIPDYFRIVSSSPLSKLAIGQAKKSDLPT